MSESTKVIAEDRFPVDVTVESAGQHYREARIIMTRPDDDVGTLKVYAAPDVVVLDTTFRLSESNIGSKQSDWGVTTDDGAVVIRSSVGCGCGNRLKWWSPPEFQPYKKGRPLR